MAYTKNPQYPWTDNVDQVNGAVLDHIEEGIEAAHSRANHGGTQLFSTITQAAARLLGRTTAGSGATEEISIGANLTLANGVLSASGTISGTIVAPFYVVVSADAPQAVKDAYPEFVCDGTADQVQINAAIDKAAALQSRAPSSVAGATQLGRVYLTGGRFNCSNSILMRTAVTVEGSGFLTEIRAVGMGANPLVALQAPDAHLTKFGKAWLNGNGASGGTGHCIDYLQSQDSLSEYPDINADSNHFIYDLYIDNFSGGTRHGIYLRHDGVGTTHTRVNWIDRITIRDLSGNGVYLSQSSDSFIHLVHSGGIITGSGFYIDGGNNRLSNCKAAYCDAYGFRLTGGRGTAVGLEAQDCATGYFFDGAPYVADGLTCDTSQADGILVSTDRLTLNGFSIYVRGGGRYATQTNGFRFDVSTYNDEVILGQIDDPNITNKVVNTCVASRSFVRIPYGTGMFSVGT